MIVESSRNDTYHGWTILTIPDQAIEELKSAQKQLIMDHGSL